MIESIFDALRFAAERQEGLTDAPAQGLLDPNGPLLNGNVVGDFVQVLHGKRHPAPSSFIGALKLTEKERLTQPRVESA